MSRDLSAPSGANITHHLAVLGGVLSINYIGYKLNSFRAVGPLCALPFLLKGGKPTFNIVTGERDD